MRKFKVLFFLLVALMLLSTPVFAQVRDSIRSTGAIQTSSTASTLGLTAGTWVYGLRIYADAANSWAAVYDAATHAATSPSSIVDEIGEATQYDTVTVWYPRPIYFANGVSVKMTTGILYILYGPPPRAL